MKHTKLFSLTAIACAVVFGLMATTASARPGPGFHHGPPPMHHHHGGPGAVLGAAAIIGTSAILGTAISRACEPPPPPPPPQPTYYYTYPAYPQPATVVVERPAPIVVESPAPAPIVIQQPPVTTIRYGY